MKKLGIFALLVSLSMIAIGCQKKDDTTPADPAPTTDPAPDAEAPAPE